MYAEIISVTENSAQLAYSIGTAGFVACQLESHPEIHSVEACGCGRLQMEKLSPDTEYRGTVITEKDRIAFHFHTLPAPIGPELDRILLTADWHISCKPENRKGRFLLESAMLAEETIREAEKLRVNAIFMAGDITNSASEEEYRIAADILKQSPVPVFSIPGNHDAPERGGWEQWIGPRTFRAELPGGVILGIDTSDYLLHKEDAEKIQDSLSADGTVSVLSHFQLFEAPDINHAAHLAIHNADDFSDVLQNLCRTRSLIWCGHQNICAATGIGSAVQINLPQVPQWPCGSILLRRYQHGILHQFIPIRSEVLRSWSHEASREAAAFYHEPQWRPEYRFADYRRCNFYWEK